MKKKVLSLLFVCVLVVSALLFTGCKTDDLEIQINDNATKAETAVNDAAAKATADLEAAKTALEALIATGDKADADALTAAVADLTAAIDAAKTAAEGADAALKTEITTAIDAAKKSVSDTAKAELDKAVKELKDAKVDVTTYNAKVAEVEAAVAAAEATAKAFATSADAALKTELTTAIATAKAEAIADAKTYVDAKVVELNAAIALKVDAATYEAKVAEIEGAIAAAEKAAKEFAEAGDKAIIEQLATAKNDVLAASKEYVNEVALDLKLTAQKNYDEFKATATELKNAILTAEKTAEKFAADADATLSADLAAAKADLVKAIAAAKAEALEEAKAYVDAEIEKLWDEINQNIDVEKYNQTIKDLEEAIKAAEEAANTLYDEADAELKADLEAKLAEADAAILKAAKAYVDQRVEALNKVVNEGKATKDELAEEILAVKAAIKAAEETAAKADADAAATAKAELEAAIEAANKAAADAWVAWNEATEEVIDILFELELRYEALKNHEYYDALSNDAKNNIFKIYNDAKVRLYRATTILAATEIADFTNLVFATIEEILEEYHGYKVEHYYDAELKEMSSYFDEAMAALEALEYQGNIAAIKKDLSAKLDAVLTKAEIIENTLVSKGTVADVTYEDAWGAHLDMVNDLIAAENDLVNTWDALAAVADKYAEYKEQYVFLLVMKARADEINNRIENLANNFAFDLYAYCIEFKTEYLSIVTTIADWDVILGEYNATNATNVAMIDRDAMAALTATYDALVAEYNKAAADLKAELDAYLTEDYVYNHNADNYAAVVELYNKWIVWEKELAENRGFAVDGEVEAPVIASAKAFVDGAYARALALFAADEKATEIELLISKLYADIDNMVVVMSEYQTRFNEINALVDGWNKAYFTETAYADEAVVGNNNYDLLDHAAYDALCNLYATKIEPIIALADALIAALEKLETITVMSGEDIEAAKNAHTAFNKHLGDLKYEIDGLGTARELTQALVDADVIFNAMCAEAVADYADLTILTKDTVNVYNKAEVEALAAWYEAYFNLTMEDTFPAGKSYTLAADLVIDATVFESAKAAYYAYYELRDAKDAELEALTDAVKALLAKAHSTKLRGEVDDVKALLDAWVAGNNAEFKPAAYADAQFAGKFEDIEGMAADVASFDAEVSTLEGYRNDIIERIASRLNKTYADLEEEDARYKYGNDIEELTKLMDDFIANMNDGYADEFADSKILIAKAELAVYQAKAIAEINAERVANDFDHEDVRTALDAVVEAAIADIVAATYDVEYEAIIDEAVKVSVTDLANINEMANVYANALANVEAITDETVKADLIARADANLNAAIAYIIANHTTVGAEFDLANANIALVEYTITKYLAYVSVYTDMVAEAGSKYDLLARLAKEMMTEAGMLEIAKGVVDEYYVITLQ